MPKRLQILLQDREYRDIRRIARVRRMSIAEWVRQALAAALRREPPRDVGKKLRAVRAAARHSYPTADTNDMLAQIQSGSCGPPSR